MSTTTVTRKWQITIPKNARKALGLRQKDRLEVEVKEDTAIIKKQPSIQVLFGSIKIPKEIKEPSWKEIENISKEYRARKTR